MKRLIALCVALVFAMGAAGLAVAQDKKSEDKKSEMKSDAKAEKKAAKAATKKPVTVKGNVKSVSADSLVLSGKDKAGKEAEWTFGVDKDTTVKVGSKKATIADVKAGDNATVAYTEADGKTTAKSVTVAAAPKKAEGQKMDAKPAAPAAEKK